MSLSVTPITVKAAQWWCLGVHRHLPAVQGGLFAVAVLDGDRPAGVAIVGHPARTIQDGWTACVLRVATDGTRNACSFLYGRCRRVAQVLGYRRLLTYTLPEEGGASLRAVAAREAGLTEGRTWSRPSRARAAPVRGEPKTRWELLP